MDAFNATKSSNNNQNKSSSSSILLDSDLPNELFQLPVMNIDTEEMFIIILDFYSVDIMWYKEFLNNGEYLKIKLDDEEED